MCGAINGFDRNIDLMFCTSVLNSREYLDLVAVVRRSTALPARAPKPSYLKQPLGATRGGGASVGPFYLSFSAPQRVLLVDGVPLIAVQEHRNVVLLNEESGGLIVKDEDSVGPELGPPIRDMPNRTPMHLSPRLRELLLAAPLTKAFIAAAALG